MSDALSAARCIATADNAAHEAAALAQRMRDIGAWGAYAAMQNLANDRAARAARVRAMVAQATRPRV